jgi:hypothetical protein
MPWNYIDIIIDNRASAVIADFKCGPGDYATKEAASTAFNQYLIGLCRKYRGTQAAASFKKLRNAWNNRQGNVTRSNCVVLAVYEHPAGNAEDYAIMLAMLVNRLHKVNRLPLLTGHLSLWAVCELSKRYPEIRDVCAKLQASH